MTLTTFEIIPSTATGTYSLANGYAEVHITGTGPTIIEFWRTTFKVGTASASEAGSWVKNDIYLYLGFGQWSISAVDNSVPPINLNQTVTLAQPPTGHISSLVAIPSPDTTYPAKDGWVQYTVTGTGPTIIGYWKGSATNVIGHNTVSDTGSWTLVDWLKNGYGSYSVGVTDGANTFSAIINNPAPVCIPTWTCTQPIDGTETNSCDGSTRPSTNPACIPAQQTYDCVNGQCVPISGGRFFEPTCGNTCSNPPPTTHKECQGGICISVQGPGTDTCSLPGETCGNSGEGKLNINTYPVPGSRIYINNMDSLAITPTELSLPPGNKFVRLVTPGYSDIIDNVEIMAGQTTTKIYVLTPLPSTSGENTGLILLAAGALGLLLIGLMGRNNEKNKNKR